MKKIFRKAMTIVGSAALIGATVGAAAAAAYPEPFSASNTAIVVGSSAAASDTSAANLIASNLDAMSSSTTTLSGGSTVTEDEVELGTAIDAAGEISSTLDEGDLDSLVDETLSWDDGVDADDFDIHEEILVSEGSNMEILTSFNDEDLEGVALSNNMALGYRLYFDDALNWSGVGNPAADTLYLTIMGTQYEISDMDTSDNSIQVVTSEEVSLAVGESVTVDGHVFTVDDVYSGSVQVNGEFIDDGQSEKVDGMRVEVDTIAYHDNAPELSKVILKIGEEISETFTDGEAYIGEDDDDPLWVWDIDLDGPTYYVGVIYNANINDANDDNAGDSIKYVGDSYVLPEGFGGVTLDGITDVSYEEVTVSFDEVDLYNATSGGDSWEGQNVMVITVPSDSVEVSSTGDSTTELYLFLNTSQGVYTNGSIEVYYKDTEGEYSPSGKARFDANYSLDNDELLSRVTVETLEIGDTDVDLDVEVNASNIYVYFSTTDDDDDLRLNIPVSGGFTQLGTNAEDSDSLDIVLGSTDLSAKDVDIMDHYGIIIDNPEDAADSDEITINFPDEQVFAKVSVSAGSTASVSSESGVMSVKDSEVSSVSGKNLVVVGGSAINSVAAELLGGAYRESAFTEATDVAAGQFLIQSFSRSGKTALLVAGYNAEDTEKAVTYLLNNDVDTSVGTKMIGTSATQATVVTA